MTIEHTEPGTVKGENATPSLRSVRLPGVARVDSMGVPNSSDYAKVMEKYRSMRPATPRAFRSEQPKKPYSGPANQPSTNKSGPIYGDNANDPYVIPALPFYESNSTSGFNDDYDEVCGPGPSTSPDVVYYFYSDHDQYITVDLCDSWYDTKVFIAYASDPLTYFACNDDACGIDGYRSRLESIRLYTDDEILIVVDGYGGAFGDYEVDIYEVTGEDAYDPIVVTRIPFTSDFSTEFKLNDYDEPCPDSSTSPDVVYYYEREADRSVTLNVCNASYDTKLFIYEGFIDPGFPFACNDDNLLCASDQFHSLIGCVNLTANTPYFIIVDGWGNQAGNYTLEITDCELECWAGCDPAAVPEGELCDEQISYNGGCYEDGSVALISPGQIVCGTMPEIDAVRFDTDWYARYMFEGDSVTWCVSGNFSFESAIMNVTDGCQPFFDAFTAGNQCDTTYLGYRIPSDGLYTFLIQPYPIGADWPCEGNPSYQAQLIVTPKCEWGFCPLISIPENEGCDESVYDDFNGGCYSNPPSFSEVPDNVYVCGTSWRAGGNWDEDVYKRHVMADEPVAFTFQPEFPCAVYVYDVGQSCVYGSPLAFFEGLPCEILDIQVASPVETDLAFVVLIRDVYSNEYLCDYGPWEYTFVFNRASDCPQFECNPLATLEGEGCEITKSQGYNAGCNSDPPTYGTIAYDEVVCGTSWYGAAGYAIWRDTDWHDAEIADGDSVVWRVTAEFEFDAFIVAVSPTCDFLQNQTIAYDSGYACDTVYLTTRKQPGQELRFVLAPRFFTPWLWCEHGDWNWEAVLTKVDESCACDCAHDPACDGVTSIFDVTHAINVAFRGAASMPDPHGSCPWETTDVDCNGVTSIFDVTRLINVAFRGADPATEFCNPCGP